MAVTSATATPAANEIQLRLIDFDTDLQDVLAVERQSWATHPWTADEFRDMTRLNQTAHYVYSVDELAVGFVSIRASSRQREILNLSVHPAYRNRGIGRRLVEHAMRLAIYRGACLTAVVRETNMQMLRLFRACGVPAAGLVPGFYLNPDEDGVFFLLKPETAGNEGRQGCCV